MPTEKLTDLLIRNLKAGTGRKQYFDEKFSGGSFGIRVTEAGHKSFFCIYRTKAGRWRRMTLGVYPTLSLAEARRNARDIVARVARGQDPQSDKIGRRKAETFAELGALYIERHAKVKKRPTSVAEDERMLAAYLYPIWRNRKIADISRRDVIEVLDEIMHERKAPVQANRVRALLSKVFNFALSRDLVPYSPVVGVPRPAKEESKGTKLSGEEIKMLWSELENRAEPTASVFRLILLTGQRPGEVKRMRWADILGDTWRIPAGIAKNGREHFVPICPKAHAILDVLRPLTGHSEWVFATAHGTHVEWLHSMVKRINKDVNEAEAASAKEERRQPRKFHLGAHALRHTAASGMASVGVHRDVIGKVLNHKSADNTVTARYDHYDRMPEMRRALERWAAKLEQIISGKTAKVVRM